MTKKQPLNPADYIEPLYMNGLRGRMLRLKPSPRKTKEILVVYGQHTSLERMFGLAESLNKYGGVTIPDLPGFGGMQSFYRLNEKPTIDNLAGYLAAFMKLRYKNRRVTIVGVSFGFAIATRMLQLYPELVRKVDLLVSTVGFVHHEDFIYKAYNYWLLRGVSSLLSHRLPAYTAQHLFLRPTFIRWAYSTTNSKMAKQSKAGLNDRDDRIAFEIHLWRVNDLRSYMYSTNLTLKLDLCRQQIELPVHHVALPKNRNLNNDFIEQHLNVIYKDVHIYTSKQPLNGPNITTVIDSSRLIPTSLRRLLAKA